MKRHNLLLGIAALAAVVTTAIAQDSLTNGLVAYYPFSGNADDSSGNGHNGNPTNAVLTTDRFGQSNAAFAFNGTNSVIGVPHSDVLNLTNTDFTLSLWAVLNAPQAVSPQFYLMAKDTGANKWIFGYGGTLQQPSRTIYFQKGEAANVWYADSRPYTANSNQWHSYMIVKAGSVYTTYIDGQSYNVETNASEPFGGNTAPLTIGNAENLSIEGKLDDIRIYNRALSGSELQQLYDYESGPRVALIKAVKPSFANLYIGRNYQLQASGDLNTWTNVGVAFNATSTSMIYPQYWDVDNWNSLFFQLQIVP